VGDLVFEDFEAHITTSPDELLASLGRTAEQVEHEVDMLKKLRKSVCTCGHGFGSHEFTNDEVTAACYPGRGFCACQDFFPVILAEDLRCFMQTTEGPGALHAFSRGMANCKKKGKFLAEYREPLQCQRCGAQKVKLYPFCLNREKQFTYRIGFYNRIWCFDCLQEVFPDRVNPAL
jgi:hypothetical protein